MKIAIKYKPNEKQKLFHACGADECVYGGAKGGGKSKALVMETLAYVLENTGATAYLFRETYDDLEANLIAEWKASVPKELYSYNEGKHLARLLNGSEVYFRYMQNDTDAEGYQGRSMDFIGIDELTKHSEKAVQILLSCLRSAKGFKPLFRATCNPGGKGHTWVKNRYILPTHKGGRTVKDSICGNLIAFIPANVYDNTTLVENDPAYVRRLENLPEAQKKAFLYGDWDIFTGQFFPEWNYDVHTCKPFEIPSHWRVYTTMDYGLDMLAHYWIAVDTEYNVYVYKELHESGHIVSEAVARIRQIESEYETDYCTDRIAPPDLWNTQSSSGKSTAILFDEAGLQLSKANNDRVAGWYALRELLKVTQSKDKEGKSIRHSRLKVFRNCEKLIEYLPQLQFSEKKPDDAAGMPHEPTHCCDALRYFAISWTYSAEEVQVVKKSYYYDEEEFDEEDYEKWL